MTSGVDEQQDTDMAIDWKKLGVALDDKGIEALNAAVAEETAEIAGQRDAARKESIDGRKGKDAKIKELTDAQEKLFERLGISSPDEIDKLPDAKGQAEAAKQYEARIKRLERERDDAVKAKGEIEGKYVSERRDGVIAKAISKHPFIDADDVRALVGTRVKAEGDDFMFEGADGKLTTIEDGVAWMAKSKPHLVRAANSGQGSGFKPDANGQGKPTVTRAEFDAKDQAGRAAFVKTGGQVVEA